MLESSGSTLFNYEFRPYLNLLEMLGFDRFFVMSPYLLIISGLPASGKTTLAGQLTQELSWPLVTKDDYKAILLEHTPEALRAESSRQLGKVSFSLMWHVADIILAARGNLVLETHFHPTLSTKHIIELARKHEAQLIQVFCHASLSVLKERHARRVASGKRPYIDMPFEHEELPEDACWEPLDLDSPLLKLDTTLSDSSQRALKWIGTYIPTVKSTSINN